MNKALQVAKVRQLLGEDNDKFDLEALIDSSLSYRENLESLKKQFPMAFRSDMDIEAETQKNYQREVEETEKIEKEAIELIKKTANPNLDGYYSDLREVVKMIAKGSKTALILTGQAGIGKSFQVIRTLSEENCFDVNCYHTGYTTALNLYNFLYEHRNDVIFFDDTQGLMNNPNALSILMGALWSSSGRRIIRWNSTSGKLKAPEKFDFNGRVIFAMNELPRTEEFKTLASRCFVYHLEFTHRQMMELMYEIAKTEHRAISKDNRIAIADFIKEETDETTIDLNLRTQAKIEELFLNSPRWKELSKKMFFGKDRDLAIVKDLLNTGIPVNEQIGRFALLTGKSRRTYFYLKKTLSK
jgi:hypothetical protein